MNRLGLVTPVNQLLLFTDGSVNTQSRIGYGAYLATSLSATATNTSKLSVKVKQFTDTSSTKLELQTLLWALEEIGETTTKITVYTDSQNIIKLPQRRVQLEQSNFHSKNGKPLNNCELYRKFFDIVDRLNCTFLKVRGHQLSNRKTDTDKLFTLVDKASRNALRGCLGHVPK